MMKHREDNWEVKMSVAVGVCIAALSVTSSTWAQSLKPVDDINELGIGTVSGRVQLFLMRRDFEEGLNDGDANAGTLALTLNYKTPEVAGLSAGVQFMQVERLFRGGSLDSAAGEDQTLNNSDFTVFNEAYIKLNLGLVGLEKTAITAGRKVLNLDFAPTYQIRQKEQSYEGIFVKSDEVEGLSLTLGHIERFSSWGSRDHTATNALEYDFVDVEDLEGAAYSTKGIEFISATLSTLPDTTLTVYDYYAHDLYNTFGAKCAYKLNLSEQVGTTLKLHYIGQRDVGRMDVDGAEVDADLYDIAIQLTQGALSVEPGCTIVTGDDADNTVHVPFRTSLSIDPEMLWYTDQFVGGTTSYYVKSTYTMEKTKLYLLYVVSDHEANVRNGATDQEVDVVVSHKFTDNLSAAVKIGMGWRDNEGGAADTNAEDCRLFLTYTF